MGTECECFRASSWQIDESVHWRVFLSWNQDYLGKCIIAVRRHEEDFLALTAAERAELWEVAGRLRDALRKLFSPDHYNYQVLGNEARHVHMHLTPRYRGPREFQGVRFADEHWGTWPYPSEVERPEATLRALAEALRQELGS